LCEKTSLIDSIFSKAQNPLDQFPRNFPVDGEAANLLRTCYGETGVMDFGLKSLMLTVVLSKLGYTCLIFGDPGVKVIEAYYLLIQFIMTSATAAYIYSLWLVYTSARQRFSNWA